jgi:hypothetical protein
MEKGLDFYGRYPYGGYSAIYQGIERSIHIFPRLAIPVFTRCYLAAPLADLALDVLIIQGLKKDGWFH